MIDRIGKYEVQAQLGQGAFGLVYRAFDPTVGRPVAIKVLTGEGKDLLVRFRTEATAAGNLQHRNIVTIYEFGEHEGRPFLAMELLEGEDLSQVIASGRKLSLLEKMRIMSQVAEGLHCAHSNGVVHRDVKPANIKLLEDGTVKILDFGIARLMRDREATRLTQQGDLIGTILYMAPEQFAGAEVDRLCDIFAYGAIYYELLTGTHPFRSPDARQVMFKITFEDPEPLRSLLPECPEILEQIVHRALQKDRELRYQSLRELEVDAQPILIDLKRARAAELLVETQGLFDKGEFEGAQAKVLEIMDLDPGNREARQIREAMHKQIQRSFVQPKIDALLATAADQLTAGKIADAVSNLDAALRLDRTNDALRLRLDEAKVLLEQARVANRLLMEARAELEKEDFKAAAAKLQAALAADPRNVQAQKLLADVETAVARRKERRNLERALQQSRELIANSEFDEAIRLLEPWGGAKQPPEVAALWEQVQAGKARQAKAQRRLAKVADVRKLLEQGSLTEALDLMRTLQKEFPRDAKLAELEEFALAELRTKHRQDAVAAILESAWALLSHSDYDQAIAALESGLERYPGEGQLAALLQEASKERDRLRRQAVLESAAKRVEESHTEGELVETLGWLDSAQREYPGEPALDQFREQVNVALELCRRESDVAAAEAESEALIARGDFENAGAVLKGALALYAGEGRLQELYETAETGLAQQRRTAAVQSILDGARKQESDREFDAALLALASGLEQFPDAEALSLELETVKGARAAWLEEARRRSEQQEQAEADSAARQKLAAGDFEAAIAVCEGHLARYPAHDGLRAIRDKAVAERSAAILKSIRQEVAAAPSFDDKAAVAERALRTWKPRTDGLTEAAIAELQGELARLNDAAGNARAMDSEAALLESAGEFEEALGKLEELLVLDPGRPGMDARIARVRHISALRTRLAEAQRLFDTRQYRAGRDLIHAALPAAKGDRRAAGICAEALVRAAEAAAEVDAASAESLLADAAEVAPAFKIPKGLRARIAERKREELVAAACEAAVALRGSGQFQAALARVEEALATVPNEDRLTGLRTAILEDRQKARARDLDELGSLGAGVGPNTRSSEIRTLRRRAREIAAGYAGDPEIQTAAEQAATRLQVVRRPLPWARIAAVSLGLLTAAVTWHYFQGRPKLRTVVIHSEPPGATVLLQEGTCVTPGCSLQLVPGQHSLQADLPGYEPAFFNFEVPDRNIGNPLRFHVRLRPLPAVMQISTNFASGGDVSLDGRPAGRLRDGQLSLPGIAAGSHSLAITSPEGYAAIGFETAPGRPAVVRAPLETRDIEAVVVSTMGREGRLLASRPAGTVTLAGGKTAQLQNGALDLHGLAEGPQELTLGDSSGERKLIVSARAAPSIEIFLASSRNVGTLVVETGEDEVAVFLNGSRYYPGKTAGGLLRIPLDVKTYTVSVQKSGFQATPSEMTAAVQRGEQSRVMFRLKALPQNGSLVLTGFVPGMEVKIDDQPQGRVPADGRLLLSVPPGTHSVEFSKAGYVSKRISSGFRAGESVALTGNQVQVAQELPPPAPPVVAAAPPVSKTEAAPTPAPPDPEADDWNRARTAQDSATLDSYLRKYPRGAHAAEVSRRLEDIEWKSVNPKDRGALQAYSSRFPNSPHGDEARQEIARLDQAARAAQEADAVRDALSRYVAAYNNKDAAGVQARFPSANIKGLQQYFRDFAVVSLRLTPEDVQVNGDTAIVLCDRYISATDRRGEKPPPQHDKPRVTLKRAGDQWTIVEVR